MQTIIRHTVLTRHFHGLTTLLCRRSQHMKKLLLAVLIGLSLVTLSGRASALWQSHTVSIERGTITYIGTYVYERDHGGVVFTTTAPPVPAGHGVLPQTINCDQFVIAKEAFNYNTAMTILLTAYASGHKIMMAVAPIRFNNELTGYTGAYDNLETCAVKELWLLQPGQ
jgi:hypothetical protein